jgi:kynurenine aminotransferase
VFCSNSPLQEAVAAGLEGAQERNFFEIQLAEYAERRTVLTSAFDRLGLKYTLPEGSYFILLVSSTFRRLQKSPCLRSCQDISNVQFPEDYHFPSSVLGRGRDFRYAMLRHDYPVTEIPRRACWFIALEIGVSSIPVSEVRPKDCCCRKFPSFRHSSTAKSTPQ